MYKRESIIIYIYLYIIIPFFTVFRLVKCVCVCFRILENKLAFFLVCGVAHPGELLVIMGASGAGKTTLLNALTFRTTRGVSVSGLMAANGRRISPGVLTSRMAYVQQDDLFIGTLTVTEHLMFQATVRMDRHIPRYQRIKRVNEVIDEVMRCRMLITYIPFCSAIMHFIH